MRCMLYMLKLTYSILHLKSLFPAAHSYSIQSMEFPEQAMPKTEINN